MSGSAAGDSAAATDQDGHCKVHTSIKLRHRKRNGEWTQLMKGCPLCSADDDDSTWSSSKDGCSPRSNHPSSPTKITLQRKRLPSVSPRTSRFKECKDDELYPGAAAAPSPRSINGCIVIDDETTEASSEDNSAQARQLRVRVTSSKLPPLPFSQEKVGESAAPCAGEAESKANLVDKPECASSLEQLITERKEKIRELRIRRLVPPSQRYQPAATSGEETGEERGTIRNSKDFHYSEASHHMGNVVSNLRPTSNVPESVTIDKIDKICQSNNKKWNSSFHSAATEQVGNISSDDGEGSHHMGRVISSFHLESIKHENNLTANGGEMQVINVPPNTDSEQPTSKGSDQGSNEQRFEASSLDISYDSFVEQMGGDLRRGQSTQRATEFLREKTDKSRREDVELGRASSGDITVVQGNTSSNKQSVPAPPNRPVIEVHVRSPERRDDLHKATRNILSSVDVEHAVRRKHGITGSSESVTKSHSFGDDHQARKGGQVTTVPGLPRSASFDNIQWNNDPPKRYIKNKSAGNEQYESWRQPALNQSNIVKDINNRLDSLHIGPAEGSRKSTKRRVREREQVVVRDVSSDEEGDECFRRGDVSHGQEPPGRRSSVKMQDKRKDAKKSSAHHTKAGHHMPDVAYSDEESDSSYDTLVNEGLDDYITAFGQVDESSPQVTRERKRLRLYNKRQEKEHSSEPLAGNISRTSYACSGKEVRSSSSERKPCAERATQKYPPPPPRRLSRSRKETRSPHSSSRKAGPTRSADAKSSHNDRHSESSPLVLPPPPPHPPKYDGGYERQASDSSQESEKIFNQVDSHGCCIRHPHVQLRRKRRLGGWKKARWKTIMMNCTEWLV